MRMLLKAQLEVEAANRVIQEGSLDTVIQAVMEKLRPEAAYFLTEDGMRTALIFFDLQDPSQIPEVAEPLFQGANASVSLTPVMTGEELQAGLERASSATP
jgi:hypothetical protein